MRGEKWDSRVEHEEKKEHMANILEEEKGGGTG